MLHLLAQIENQAPAGGFSDLIDRLARTPLGQIVPFVALCTIVRLAIYPYLKNTLPHKRTTGFKAVRLVNEALDAIVYAIVVVFLIIRPFGIQTFKIPSESMVDTLLVNDFIIANKAVYRYSDPQVNDIVVFKPPRRALTDGVEKDFIKRVVGVAGDVIEIKAGTLYRNGKPIDEPYVKEKPLFDFKLIENNGEYWPLQMSASAVNMPSEVAVAQDYAVEDFAKMEELRAKPAVAIPKGYIMCMGDNRRGSFDSRGWGLVPVQDVIGRSEVIWLPFSRWRRTR